MSDNLYPHPNMNANSSSNKRWLWVLGGCGGALMLLTLVMCGGGIAVAMFGLNLVEEELKVQLSEHPQVQQHLGELEEFNMNLTKSGAIDDGDTFIYDATGSKGSAEFTIVSSTSFDGPEEIESASMRLPDGKVIELNLDGVFF